MLETVMTSDGLMMVPVFQTQDDLRDAWDHGELTMNDPFLYKGMVCEVVAMNRGE